MNYFNYVFLLLMTAALSACGIFKQKSPETAQRTTTEGKSTKVITESRDAEAFQKATSYAKGWPDTSVNAAKEIISKYGDPTEVTQDSLVWRNVAPFKKIIVHKEVFSHRFPLLHQTPVEHVVNYKARGDKVDEIWRFSGAVSLDRVKGEMSALGLNESMNILSMNLAHDIFNGKRTPEDARIRFGQETMDYLNGYRNPPILSLNFGNQVNTADLGVTITDKIRWSKESRKPAARLPQINLRQAQEE